MNLLLLNFAVDEDDVTLSHCIDIIDRLSKQFKSIYIITMRTGNFNLPSNVYVKSLESDKTNSKIILVIRFYIIALKLFLKKDINIVFSHMNAIFGALYGLLKIFTRVKHVLWYEHRSTPLSLKIAHFFADYVISASPQGFRLSSKKKMSVGHTIDCSKFILGKKSWTEKTRVNLISVSRLSPSKGIDLMLDALSSDEIEFDWNLKIIGSASNEDENDYVNRLKKFVNNNLNLKERVEFMGRLNQDNIIEELNKSDYFLHLSNTGSLDKAILEAAAIGCIPISSNQAFYNIATKEGFEECLINRTSDSILKAINYFSQSKPKYRDLLSRKLSLYVHENHNSDINIQKIVFKLKDLAK